MTKGEIDILIVLIGLGGLLAVMWAYLEWRLIKIARGLKDIAEGLQKLGKSPKKKGGDTHFMGTGF